MRHMGKKLVEIEVCISECDFCNYKTETDTFTTNICCICNRDTCRDHTYYFEEEPFSYHYITTCPVCHTLMEKAWEWALEYVGRNEDIRKVAIERFHKLKEKLEQT